MNSRPHGEKLSVRVVRRCEQEDPVVPEPLRDEVLRRFTRSKASPKASTTSKATGKACRCYVLNCDFWDGGCCALG